MLLKTGLGILTSLLTMPGTGSDPGNDPWSQFRGPNGSGVHHSTNLPVKLDSESNLVWRRPLANGYSSPVLGQTTEFF